MLSLELGSIDGLCLIRCCHCRRDQIDKEIERLFSEASNSNLDETTISAIIALDGERYLIDRLLEKLWRVKDH